MHFDEIVEETDVKNTRKSITKKKTLHCKTMWEASAIYFSKSQMAWAKKTKKTVICYADAITHSATWFNRTHSTWMHFDQQLAFLRNYTISVVRNLSTVAIYGAIRGFEFTGKTMGRRKSKSFLALSN